jgi:hypothetical protein
MCDDLAAAYILNIQSLTSTAYFHLSSQTYIYQTFHLPDMSDTQKALVGESRNKVQECASSDLNRHLAATDSGYKSRRLAIQQFHRAVRQGESISGGFTQSLLERSYSIPVVFHIVHYTADQNISDEQIDSQLNVLNADYNGKNEDLVKLPAAFQPLLGVANISFHRARRDPQGAFTDGVTRTRTNVPGFTSFDTNPVGGPDSRMKSASTGGVDPWPTEHYLNIWVCDLGMSLYGYAQFPGGPPASDGVVISYNRFGTLGTAIAGTNFGRTGTHEVGHWLDCYHIWGDDGTSCTGTDHCDDTPNQAGSNSGTPTFPSISCNNGPNGDLFFNHMDYTGHSNRIMFTKGQVDRMHTTLAGPRASLTGYDYFEFVLHTGTVLHETDDTFKILMGDINRDGRPDLVAIKKSGTSTNSTEVHVLSGASNFQTLLVQTGTGLHETSTAQFDFALADWNGDGFLDLIAIKKNNTGTGKTEVHILSGASNFREFILHVVTDLHETGDTFAFAMGNWESGSHPDLFAISKSSTGTNSTEVHVLSGSTNYSTFILHTGTALPETDSTYDFVVTDWNGDGRPDLVAIQKSSNSKSSTQVHVLSGASGYKNFILHSDTALHKTDGTFEFAVADWTRDGRLDLVAFKKKFTGTNSTEVHIMAG